MTLRLATQCCGSIFLSCKKNDCVIPFPPTCRGGSWDPCWCEHGPIGIEKDACPVCGSTWLSQNDGAVDSDDMESLDELREKEYGNEGVEGIYNWDEWN